MLHRQLWQTAVLTVATLVLASLASAPPPTEGEGGNVDTATEERVADLLDVAKDTDEREKARLAALQSLGSMDDATEQTVKGLLQVLRDSEQTEEVRLKALALLDGFNVGSTDIAPVMVDILRGVGDNESSRTAVRLTLTFYRRFSEGSAFSPSDTAPILLDMLKGSEQTNEARKKALELLDRADVSEEDVPLVSKLVETLGETPNTGAVRTAILEGIGVSLPRVLLIGDSICGGYTPHVRKLLEGQASVYKVPTNGGSSTKGMQRLDKWMGSGNWDVIHFNFGVHDLRPTPLNEYKQNLRLIVMRLREASGAELIFGMTTPIPAGHPHLSPGQAKRYNKVALDVMKDCNVRVNDLYQFIKPHQDRVGKAHGNLHFSNEGYQMLARKVAEAIRSKLLTGVSGD